MVHSDYLHVIFEADEFATRLNNAERALANVEFDAFAVRGHSGCLFGGALAARMRKKLILIRKHADDAHCRMDIEGDASGNTYIFLDDLVCSGRTKKLVRTEIENSERFGHYKFVGQYMFQDEYFSAYTPPSPNVTFKFEPPVGLVATQVNEVITSYLQTSCQAGTGWMAEFYKSGMDLNALKPPPWSAYKYKAGENSLDTEGKQE